MRYEVVRANEPMIIDAKWDEPAWQKVFSTAKGEGWDAVAQDAGGDLFVCGRHWESGSAMQLLVARLTPSGDPRWQGTYGRTNGSIASVGLPKAPADGIVVGADLYAGKNVLSLCMLTLPRTGVLPGASFVARMDIPASAGSIPVTDSRIVPADTVSPEGVSALRPAALPSRFFYDAETVRALPFGDGAGSLGFAPAADETEPVPGGLRFADDAGALWIDDVTNRRVVVLDQSFAPSVPSLPLGDVSFGALSAGNGRLFHGAQGAGDSFLVIDPSRGTVVFQAPGSDYPIPGDASVPKYYSYADNLLIGELDVVPAAGTGNTVAHEYRVFSLEMPTRPGARATWRSHEETLSFIRAKAKDKAGLWVDPRGLIMYGSAPLTRNTGLLLRYFLAFNPRLWSAPAYRDSAGDILGADRDGYLYVRKGTLVSVLGLNGDALAAVHVGSGSSVAVDSNGTIFELAASREDASFLLLRHERSWGYRAVPGVIGADDLNIRRYPATTSVSLGKLARAAAVTVLARSKDRMAAGALKDYWYRVRTADGTVGWVFGAYLAVPASAPWEVLP